MNLAALRKRLLMVAEGFTPPTLGLYAKGAEDYHR